MLFAAAAFAVPMAVSAQNVQPFGKARRRTDGGATEVRHRRRPDSGPEGQPVMNGTNELCWRDGSWTPATAYPGCDGAVALPPPPPPAPAPKAAPPAPPPRRRRCADPDEREGDLRCGHVLRLRQVRAQAWEGMAKLDDLVSKMKGMNL